MKKGIISKCLICNKEIYISQCLIGKKKFCSRTCLGKGTKKRSNSKNVNCHRCDKIIHLYFHRIEKSKNGKFYCSNFCRRNREHVECPICKKNMIFCKSTIDVRKSKTKFCSKSCLSEGKKEGLTTWGFINEGKKHGNNARKRIFINGKYFYLHRLIMEEYLGRKLLSSEIVHHINGDPKDNRLENLMITKNAEHGKIHKPKRSISS